MGKPARMFCLWGKFINQKISDYLKKYNAGFVFDADGIDDTRIFMYRSIIDFENFERKVQGGIILQGRCFNDRKQIRYHCAALLFRSTCQKYLSLAYRLRNSDKPQTDTIKDKESADMLQVVSLWKISKS